MFNDVGQEEGIEVIWCVEVKCVGGVVGVEFLRWVGDMFYCFQVLLGECQQIMVVFGWYYVVFVMYQDGVVGDFVQVFECVVDGWL